MGSRAVGRLPSMNTPEHITDLEPNQVVVFGSNRAGRHSKGAALTARRKWGARMGQGTGLMGQCYGIATKGHRLEVLSLPEIAVQVERLYRFATAHPELTFLVTKIGCGLAHYSIKQVKAACFDGLTKPANVVLPVEFV